VSDFTQGQYVAVDNPKYRGVYQVSGEGPANLHLTRVAGGRGLKVPKGQAPNWLRAATAPEVAAARAERPAVTLDLAMVVAYKHPEAAGHLFVVVKLWPDGKVNLVQLGGHPEHRYWPKVSPLHVTVVAGDDLEAAYRKAGGVF